ncbi:MAG: cytochrome c biogenesis CcdA family protein [Hyphomicrobiales bacterium]|nr:cytochrome c biogenesis CcdA family protein [Hyphomicrobiales bacterium]
MEVTYIGALIAGLISFLSPCVLPLVPPYLCFLGGATFDQLSGEGEVPPDVYREVVLAAIAFVFGFTTVFVSLGATATAIGQLIAGNLELLAKVAGVAIIIVGLHFLGILKLPFLYREFRSHAVSPPAGLLGAYLVGLAFAFGWTPCIGPVLAAILAVAAAENSVSEGIILLFIYSMGLGIPFIAAALAFGPFMGFLTRFRKHLGRVEKVMGGMLVVTGVMFITGSMTTIAVWMLETFPGLATIG